MGGGVLFRSLLDAGLVDFVDLAVLPLLLGDGIPLLPGGERCPLRLEESKALPSGILVLRYSVAR
jgi:dihydrofolate reductase